MLTNCQNQILGKNINYTPYPEHLKAAVIRKFLRTRPQKTCYQMQELIRSFHELRAAKIFGRRGDVRFDLEYLMGKSNKNKVDLCIAAMKFLKVTPF
jgi:hypothetical protein